MAYCEDCGEFDPAISVGEVCNRCRLHSEKSIVVDDIKKMMARGESPIILVTGKARIGKTRTIESFIYNFLNKGYNPRTDLFYTIDDFIMFNDKGGHFKVLDEMGIELYYLKFANYVNRVFHQFTMTQGRKALCIFLVVPFGLDLAKLHFSYIHYHMHVFKKGKKKGYIKVQKLSSPAWSLKRKIYKRNIEIINLHNKFAPQEIVAEALKIENENKDRIENDLKNEIKKGKEQVERRRTFEDYIIETIEDIDQPRFISITDFKNMVLKKFFKGKRKKDIPHEFKNSQSIGWALKRLGFKERKQINNKRVAFIDPETFKNSRK